MLIQTIIEYTNNFFCLCCNISNLEKKSLHLCAAMITFFYQFFFLFQMKFGSALYWWGHLTGIKNASFQEMSKLNGIKSTNSAGLGDSSSSNKMVSSENCKMTNEINSDQMMANGNNAGSALSKVCANFRLQTRNLSVFLEKRARNVQMCTKLNSILISNKSMANSKS